MPREARIVAPGLLHHVTQRGNNHEAVFLSDEDRLEYLSRLRNHVESSGVAVFGFCLLTNHVHLVLRPERKDGLARLLRRAHSEYAQGFNRRRGRSGHLWQGRFYSCPLERGHAWIALRYVDLNPVRARIVEGAEQWRWSSARAHTGKEIDEFGLLCGEWLEWRDWPDWRDYLKAPNPDEERRLRENTKQSRPLGSREFVRHWEGVLGRPLEPRKRGRPQNPPLVNQAATALLSP
jgi:putative transposase